MSTDSDVFAKIVNRMLSGIMFHDQMYQYFLFLRLYSFAKTHKKRYNEESNAYQKVNKYYITHRDALIEERPVNPVSYIPVEWRKMARFNLTSDDIRKATIFAANSWVTWEQQTKTIYTDCYNDLIKLGYAAEADLVMGFVRDVDKELSEAVDIQLYLEAIKYDMTEIMEMNK